MYRKWSGHKEAREHNAQSLFWVIAIKLHDLDTEEHRQGVGPKCLVPKLFERRFVSMASLDVSLVGLAWSPDFVILGGTHMESRFCQIVFRCGVHSSGRVWCILSCVWLSGCWLCDHLGVGRQALARPLPHILGEVHLRYRCVLRRRKDWHLLPSSSHCRGVLRRRRDRPSSSQCRQVLRRREGTGPPPRILEDFSPFLKCDLVLRAVPLVLTVLKPVQIHSCSSWTTLLTCSVFCLLPMSEHRGDSTGAVLGQVVVSGADVQTALNTRGDSTGAVLGQVVHARCCVWCRCPDSAEHPWRFHRCRSWDKLFMPVVVSGADVQTAQNTRGDSTGAVLGQVVHARCCVWCRCPDSAEHPVEIPQVPFLDKLFMHVVVFWCGCPDSAEHPWRFHRCRSWTSCSCTLLCLVRMSRQRRTPVEIPQVPFLDKLFMHVVVSGADG